LHPRQRRPFGTAFGVLREQCSLVTILASQRACMRVVVRRLAAVLLEFPAHPASVPERIKFQTYRYQNKKPTRNG